VLITESTTDAFNILLPLLSGIVTDNGGLLLHAAIVAREYGIPGAVGHNREDAPGFGLYRHMLDDDDDAHLRFAVQCGATHLVAHLVDYFAGRDARQRGDQPVGDRWGWGRAGDPKRIWTAGELTQLRKRVESAGLKLAAIENLDPAHWGDVLTDGPRRAQHIQNVKSIIRALGEAAIPMLGYYFSLAGVAGRTTGPYARGGATAVGMEGPVDDPLPAGIVWNMVVDEAALDHPHPSIDAAMMRDRRRRFLDEVLPVAERAGVRLAAHPDDPPLPVIRQTPRLLYQPRLLQELLDDHPSPANAIELCVGTLAESTDTDAMEWIDRYAAAGRIGYVHLRNVRGKAPHYRETFIDDGDVDVLAVLRTLDHHNFDGVIIPDHAPQTACAAPWHAGMAFAMGYLRAAMQVVAAERTRTREGRSRTL
jgi:mannonate dehydratase